MRHLGRFAAASLCSVSIMLASSVWASADTQVLYDGPSAAGLCSTSYPGVSAGADELSPCQWDMDAIDAPEAWARSTGRGVKVGVIDGGVDFTHPDLAGAIDVGLSCSFIFSTTPTADPAEVANGDCSNKAAVQDLQGHGSTYCPNPKMTLWNQHPRVFIDVATTGEGRCPYCGTVYRLKAGEHLHGH